jgi:hypothetical protein
MNSQQMKAALLEALLAELYDDDFAHWDSLAEMYGGTPAAWGRAREAVARRLETLRSQYPVLD